MTTGDLSGPKATTFMRSTSRAGSSSSSHSGGGGVVGGDEPAGDDDVLDRLARLGEVEPIPPAADDVGIPAIVEADPTYPPLAMASTGLIGTAVLDDLQTIPDMPLVVEPAIAPSTVPADESDHVPGVVPDAAMAVAARTARQTPRPVTFQRRKPRVRRVTRVVRHVDTWSIFKVALVFNAVLYLVCLTAGVLLWNVANSTGTVDNIEKFFEQFGWERFEFKGGELYHNLWIGGLFVAVGLTGLAVLLATIFNLITDLVGGIRVSVLEEEVIARAPARMSDRPDASARAG
ncbi:MAG: DUF3566 domain-containing protein [Ilumatobacteraceae bacterium]